MGKWKTILAKAKNWIITKVMRNIDCDGKDVLSDYYYSFIYWFKLMMV